MKRLLVLPLLLLGGLMVACSDDDNGDSAPADTPTSVAAEESPSPEELPQGLQFVLDSASDGILIADLREHLSPELEGMSDDELTRAVSCFPSDVNAEVLDQRVTESGDSATLVEVWQVTEVGASAIETEVEREWTFEQVTEGEATGYVITGLPSECPFEASDPGGTQEPSIETPESDDDD